MKAEELLRIVRDLPEKTLVLPLLEAKLKIGPGYGRAWYSSQKEHWIKWLEEYPTSGPYGRRPSRSTDAKTVYNRVMCPPMVFWLPEAAGVDERFLRAAFDKAVRAKPSFASRSAAVRDVLPWGLVEEKLLEIVGTKKPPAQSRLPAENSQGTDFITY